MGAARHITTITTILFSQPNSAKEAKGRSFRWKHRQCCFKVKSSSYPALTSCNSQPISINYNGSPTPWSKSQIFTEACGSYMLLQDNRRRSKQCRQHSTAQHSTCSSSAGPVRCHIDTVSPCAVATSSVGRPPVGAHATAAGALPASAAATTHLMRGASCHHTAAPVAEWWPMARALGSLLKLCAAIDVQSFAGAGSTLPIRAPQLAHWEEAVTDADI